MKSVLCLVDTCSLIYMRDIEVRNKALRLWLWDEFYVKVSEEICTEIQRHRDLAGGGIINRCNRSKWSFNISVDRLERTFLEPFGFDVESTKNRGERHNCCVALDAVMRGEHRHVIFLTDELRAIDPERNGLLRRLFEAFPIGCIWSSLDFILYLFIRQRKRFPKLLAEAALRTVNARIGGRPEVAQKRLVEYNRRLGQIESTLSQLPQI